MVLCNFISSFQSHQQIENPIVTFCLIDFSLDDTFSVFCSNVSKKNNEDEFMIIIYISSWHLSI